jgi:2-polyprenyl-6-methoxyphenol hydroxylase-like FAD-dependent oxidoreductase
MAAAFGKQNCWLAGDAAHQAGPAAAQSMNQGFIEGADLATAIIKIQKGEGNEELLAAYAKASFETWQKMLGLSGGAQPPNDANAWIKANWNRILPSLPATGDDLAKVAARVQAV